MYKTPLDLSIAYQNIEGIHNLTFGYKLAHITSKFIHDIEVLSETWGECKHETGYKGYKLITIPLQKIAGVKKGRSSGGLLIYYKEHLKEYIKSCVLHYIWIELDKSLFFSYEKNVKLYVAYTPLQTQNTVI